MGASPIPAATDAESGRVQVNPVWSLVDERHGPVWATRFRIAFLDATCADWVEAGDQKRSQEPSGTTGLYQRAVVHD